MSAGPFGVDVQALQTVGTVLAEAIILYVGYGALTSALSGRLKEALRSDQ